MDVDECIVAYNELMSDIFSIKRHKFPINWRGKVQPQFESGKLSAAIEKVIKNRGLSPEDTLNNGNADACKMFVYSPNADGS